jgi:hypothetical protein
MSGTRAHGIIAAEKLKRIPLWKLKEKDLNVSYVLKPSSGTELLIETINSVVVCVELGSDDLEELLKEVSLKVSKLNRHEVWVALSLNYCGKQLSGITASAFVSKFQEILDISVNIIPVYCNDDFNKLVASLTRNDINSQAKHECTTVLPAFKTNPELLLELYKQMTNAYVPLTESSCFILMDSFNCMKELSKASIEDLKNTPIDAEPAECVFGFWQEDALAQ